MRIQHQAAFVWHANPETHKLDSSSNLRLPQFARGRMLCWWFLSQTTYLESERQVAWACVDLGLIVITLTVIWDGTTRDTS